MTERRRRIPAPVLRTLELPVGRRITGAFMGDHNAHGRSGGTELEMIRPYVPGDDVRRIDWNVTARTGVAHVREPVAERVLTSWVVADVSPSMSFGTADRTKWDVASGVIELLAHVGSRRRNRVGVLTYGGTRDAFAPPRGGRTGRLTVARAAAATSADATGVTDLREVLHRAVRLVKRGSLVVIVGDLRGPRDWDRALGLLCAKCEVIAIEIRDRREQELVGVGHLRLVDPETERQLVVDTSSREVRTRFAKAAREERDEVADMIRRAGVRHAVLTTHGDRLLDLTAFLRAHGRAS